MSKTSLMDQEQLEVDVANAKRMLVRQPGYVGTREKAERTMDSLLNHIVALAAERNEIQETLAYVQSQVAKVYCEITNDRISKCNTPAEAVIAVADDVLEKRIDDAVLEEIQALTAENERLRGALEWCGRFVLDGSHIDGGAWQDEMARRGILVEVPATEEFKNEWDSDTMYVLEDIILDARRGCCRQ